jgi:hypothetical protein
MIDNMCMTVGLGLAGVFAKPRLSSVRDPMFANIFLIFIITQQRCSTTGITTCFLFKVTIWIVYLVCTEWMPK